METIDKIDVLCKEMNTSISQLEKDLGFSNGSLRKSKSIKADKLLLISYKFNVPMELLVETDDGSEEEFAKRIKFYQAKFKNVNNSWKPSISKKEEKDIEKRASGFIESIGSDTGLMFNGQPIDDETRALFQNALEVAMKTASLAAKEKFTPNKYKK